MSAQVRIEATNVTESRGVGWHFGWGRRIQARFEHAVRLAGYLDFPLLPSGLSSPVSEKVQSS